MFTHIYIIHERFVYEYVELNLAVDGCANGSR